MNLSNVRIPRIPNVSFFILIVTALAIAIAVPVIKNRLDTRSQAAATPLAYSVQGGKYEIVNKWLTDHCYQSNISHYTTAVRDMADAQVRPFIDADGNVQIVLGDYFNRRDLGENLTDTQHLCPVIFEAQKSSNPNDYTHYSWINGVYTEDGNTIYGLTHTEYHGYEWNNCNVDNAFFNCWWNTTNGVISTNKGATFAYQNPIPNQNILRPQTAYNPNNTNGHIGFFQATNIVKKDGYYYFISQAHDPIEWKYCLARTNNLADTSSWRMWDGSGFSIPGRGGGAGCARVGGFYDHLSYNNYLDRYVSVHNGASFEMNVTTDATTLTSWEAVKFFNYQSQMGQPAGEPTPYYLTLVQPGDPTRNFEQTGRSPWVYYTVKRSAVPAGGSVSAADAEASNWDNYDLARVRVRFNKSGEENRYELIDLQMNEKRGKKTLDSAFYTNDGALSGDAQLMQEGRTNLVRFSGAGNVQVAHNASLNLATQATFKARVRLLANPAPNQYMTIIRKESDAAHRNFFLGIDPSGKLHFSLSKNGAIVGASSSTVVAPLAWHNIVVTYDDASGNASFYIDNVPSGTVNLGTQLAAGQNTAPVFIGDQGFNGDIDAVTIYNYITSSSPSVWTTPADQTPVIINAVPAVGSTPLPTSPPLPTATPFSTPTLTPTNTPTPTITPTPVAVSTVRIFAAGSPAGGVYPSMNLVINGTTVKTFPSVTGNPDTRNFVEYTYPSATKVTPSQVKVSFTNDTMIGAEDRNLQVDKILVDGIAYETESPTTATTGTNDSTGCTNLAYKQSEVLHCNGYFAYAQIASTTPTSTPLPTATPTLTPSPTLTPTPLPVSTVRIFAAGSSAGGVYPSMDLLVNGVSVATYPSVTGVPSSRTFVEYVYPSNTKILPSQVKVRFTNDIMIGSEDRNLQVDKIIVDGVTYESEAPSTATTGTNDNTGCTNLAFKGSEVLHCNGYFAYGQIPNTPTSTPTPIYNGFKGEYFTNPNLTGNPTITRDDPAINFSWPDSPAAGIPADNFSVRWTKNVNFDAGRYVFSVASDDGMRVWVDNNIIYDKWIRQSASEVKIPVQLSAGTHVIKVEYNDIIYGGVAKVSWIKELPVTSYLSNRAWTYMTNGWGPAEIDRNNNGQAAGDGGAIRLNTTYYAKGIGAHASSDIRYNIGGKCTNFTSYIGVDDGVGAKGSIVFQVYADGTKLYDSGLMNGASATKNINVNLEGKNELKLILTNAGDNMDYDHGDWADAQITCYQ